MNATTELIKLKASLADKKCMSEHEVLDLLGEEFPNLNTVLERSQGISIYKTVQCFAEFTKQLVSKENFTEVKHCFSIAEKILREGNKSAKNAIENCYLFSVSCMLDLAGHAGQQAKGLLSGSLKKEYLRQVHTSGI